MRFAFINDRKISNATKNPIKIIKRLILSYLLLNIINIINILLNDNHRP